MTNRQFLSGIIIGFYFVPLLFFISYSIYLLPPQKSWSLLSLGLLLMMSGTLFLIVLLYYWEKSLLTHLESVSVVPIETKVTPILSSPVSSFTQQVEVEPLTTKEINLSEEQTLQFTIKISELQAEIEQKTLLYQESLDKATQTMQDFADYKLFSEEQLRQKQMQLDLLQQTLEGEREEMEKRQEHIQQLNAKVQDLGYELETLLHLNEEETLLSKPTSTKKDLFSAKLKGTSLTTFSLEESIDHEYGEQKFIQHAQDATRLLHTYISMAEKLTGQHYYSNEGSRYRDFSTPYYTIDQRRLFDHLRNEKNALLVIYSQKEHKLLFANTLVKKLIGWSSEKFITDFSFIMQAGMEEWKKGLAQLQHAPETHIRLLAKAKDGKEIMVECHLGVISSGLFTNYVIGIFYPT